MASTFQIKVFFSLGLVKLSFHVIVRSQFMQLNSQLFIIFTLVYYLFHGDDANVNDDTIVVSGAIMEFNVPKLVLNICYQLSRLVGLVELLIVAVHEVHEN